MYFKHFLNSMTDCWVFVAKRENESVSDTIDIIKRNFWDFISKSGIHFKKHGILTGFTGFTGC